jgi:uncharacterized protein with ATP-grasp and redox domains
MRLQSECIGCNIQQVNKVLKIMNITDTKKEEVMSAILHMLSTIDYSLSNPEVMKKTWDIICAYVDTKDPYRNIKESYNQALLEMDPELQTVIEQAKNSFVTAMKMATLANIIDFSANDNMNIQDIHYQLLHASEIEVTKDDSDLLQKQLETAKTVVYIGDNCGEIVLDKIFMEIIKKKYVCDMYYIVRDAPIVNDVTMMDAKMVGIDSVAKVISSGDGSLGLVVTKTSIAFQELFFKADVVIAKGQGNFEGLYDVQKENMFHLFMVKCGVMERIMGIKKGSIVCIKKS